MQFKAFESGIEVNGTTIFSVVKGAGVFENTAARFLTANGLPDVKNSADAWYPQQAWLETFREMQSTVGRQTVFLIGKKIPETAVFPPHIVTITDALGSIDVAYHMNHRKGGKVMFDPATGKMLEGIGHYAMKSTGPTEAVLTCQNPYPCHFDRGIITAMAWRFKDHADIRHVDEKPCREKGAESCEYVVRWS
jgi:hypothetical protein